MGTGSEAVKDKGCVLRCAGRRQHARWEAGVRTPSAFARLNAYARSPPACA
jgi:hypothetical protein